MILNDPDNRKLVTQYLEALSEDQLIDQFIIPIFARYGYRVYRIVQHGPGEHGTDVLFSRYDPLHMTEEFIAVQAKAEKVSVNNVPRFANQIKRAMKVGFPRLAGKGNITPQYVFFMNSKRHTNDAHVEFMQLVDDPNHTRIFAQDNLCDLIMRSGMAPKSLLNTLTISSPLDEQDVNSHIFQVLMSDEPRKVDHLLDHEVKLVRNEVTERLQRMIIDFAKQKWDEDGSWAGIVRPMRWFNTYFEFFHREQYPYLFRVIEEYTTTNHSFDAASDTHSVFKKITPDHVSTFEVEFARQIAAAVASKLRNWKEIVDLAREALKAKKIKHPMVKAAVAFADEKSKPTEKRDVEWMKDLGERLDKFLYPD